MAKRRKKVRGRKRRYSSRPRKTKKYARRRKTGRSKRRTRGRSKKVKTIKRRWPGFTATRPKTRHYEVLHQAWSRGRGNWYLIGFAKHQDEAKRIASNLGRPGDYAYREVIDGKPSSKYYRATNIAVRTVRY